MLKKDFIERDRNLEPLENPNQVSGFASPADDYKEDRLHIIQKLVTDPTNTFYFEVDNDNLIQQGITKSAIVIVDRSITVILGKIVVVTHENEWLIRKLIEYNGKWCLVTDSLEPLYVTAETIFFGVATYSCNPLSTKGKNDSINRL